jgi:hypothetical protein
VGNGHRLHHRLRGVLVVGHLVTAEDDKRVDFFVGAEGRALECDTVSHLPGRAPSRRWRAGAGRGVIGRGASNSPCRPRA